MYPALLLFSLLLIAPAPVTAAIVYNANTDFSIVNGNPNGVWTYGYLNNAGNSFTKYTRSTAAWHGNENLKAWSQFMYDSNAYSVVGKNPSGSVQSESPGGSQAIDPGQLFTHPGNGGEKGTFRFTAPSSGTVNIIAGFQAADTTGGSRDVHVYINGIDQIPGSTIVGSKGIAPPVSYSGTNIPVIAGTTIDFSVGYISDYNNDQTTLQAVVNFSPTLPPPTSGCSQICVCQGEVRCCEPHFVCR